MVTFTKEKGGGAVGMTLDLYKKKMSPQLTFIYYTLKVNPFTALACNISRLNDARTCPQTVYIPVA